MNIELLRKVQAHIMEEPARLLMSRWSQRVTGKTHVGGLWEGFKELPVPSCGTVCCIAGWTCVISQRKPSEEKAIELLELDMDQGDRLFLVGQWPEAFAIAYFDADTPEQRAQVACGRIDRFIKTDGSE